MAGSPRIEARRNSQIKNYSICRKSKKLSGSHNEKDFVELDEYQQQCVDHRMKGNARSWEPSNGIIEEWTPWNRYGEPINIWRYYKK